MASLTYAEIASALGITIGSAKNLVRRKHWKRTTGNDGAARISVPDEYLNAYRKPVSDVGTNIPTDGTYDAATPPVSVSGQALEALREQISRLSAQNDRLSEQSEELRELVRSLQGEVILHKANSENAERELKELREQAAAWRANAEWMAQPWIARLIKSLWK